MNSYSVIIHKDIYTDTVRGSILGSKAISQYIITEHHEDCGYLTTFGPHYHVMVWTERNFGDIQLGRHLRHLGTIKATYA